MNTLWVMPVVLIFALVASSHAVTNDSAIKSTDNPIVIPTDAPTLATGQATGSIDLIDRVKELIRVQDRTGQQLSFYVETNTPIFDSGRRQLAFDDLKPGDVISVNYSAIDYTVNEIQKVKS